jgi:hypothetical protein
MSGSGLSCNPIISEGSAIKPPPPATASTKPAKPEAIARKAHVAIDINYAVTVE